VRSGSQIRASRIDSQIISCDCSALGPRASRQVRHDLGERRALGRLLLLARPAEVDQRHELLVVVDFVVGQDAMVWPMVPAGTSNDEILAARDTRPVWGEDDV